ncbi:hypothetical protein R69658_02541 [Paraburkholderia aspalathi]|uniref:Uncharacterized protein n=1 Tax=Paraburkholderia aspalathi TaxID=1324617 RepID=A0ABN7LFJ5_9BURK|nr:hypothetical protein [Paraburkholderia aspalathi]MBK3817805.1 hypothetical protein [Paraburkholderia aspalathi]MBK3829579.1 hypothetical protein [Paraburkholderia aspalathi]MBK3859399.1 hypothetical protein [Paraburkholderia aspalathi]CAE6747150.1 hypothetical protein R69658_02541 [Paraburkholderia aspalathi]
MKRTTILKSRISELNGELERATAERTAALTAVGKAPKDEAAHARLSAAIDACKQIAGVIASMEEALEGAGNADAAEVLASHRTEMIAARDRMQSAVVARVQSGAKVDKALETLRTALTEWHQHTETARRELSLASVGAVDADQMPANVYDNRLLQLSAVAGQLDSACDVPAAFAQALRRAGVCGPLDSHAIGPAEGPIPLNAFIDFHTQAAGSMLLHHPGTVREAAQRAADSVVCTLDNWHRSCNVIETGTGDE